MHKEEDNQIQRGWRSCDVNMWWYVLFTDCIVYFTHNLFTVHVILLYSRPTIYWSTTQCDLLLYFREFCKWMWRKSRMSPTFHQHPQFTVQYLPPYSLLLTVSLQYNGTFSNTVWKLEKKNFVEMFSIDWLEYEKK